MPDAIITSTASTFGTITGTFAADQSTITGTVTGIITGTLDGSVGVPGPAGAAGAPGVGVPAGGASGQYLQKTSNADYATDWVTVNLSAYAVKANNLSDLGSISTARDNLGLGSLSTPTFAGVNVPGSGTSVANLGATSLTINQQGSGQFTIQPSQGIVFPNGSIQTTAFTGVPADYITSVSSPLSVTSGNLSVDLSAYLTTATAASTYQTLSGMSAYLTTSAAASTYQTLSGMSDYLSKAGNLAGLANTGTARTNLGLGSLAVVNDAPSDGSQYARKNAAWEVVTSTSPYITSVSSPLSVTSGNLTIDLSSYLTSGTAASTYQTLAGMSSYLTTATAASTYAVIAAGQPTAGTTGQVLTKNSGTNYDSSWATLIPGDRYLTSSTTSNTVSNGNKTFTIGTGLSYTPTQNITISYDASNHMHGEVLTYNSGTGALSVDVNHHTGSGTYTAWVVNVGGVTPATSVAWGAITGTLSAQTDLQSALDAKLAVTTAASTYQTLSGMSSYLTTSTAASTYAALAGATFTGKVTTIASTTGTAPLNIPHGSFPTTPSNGDIWTTGTGIFSQVNGSSFQFAPVASPGFSGVPTAPTATAGTSTTQIATTAFVTTADNLKADLASPALTGTPTAPTAAAATNTTQIATTAFVTTADNLKANLASPTFTGVPAAPTATAGTNTTQIATTAFVTAAVPAIATVAQVYASTSSTTATPPLLAPLAFNSGGYFPRMNFASTTSGTGASVGGADHRFEIIGPNVATAGFAQIRSEHQQLWSAGTTFTILQFSKPVWLSFRMCNFSATYDGDAQTEIKAFIGNEVSGGVDPTGPAVGIYKAGGSGSFINLMVHNGTTLTKVATTTTFSTTVVDVAIYSNNGTVNLYLNGVLAATTTAGPTGTSNTTRVTAAVKATVTAAVRQLLEIANIKVFAPQ